MKPTVIFGVITSVVILAQNGYTDGANILAYFPFSAKSHHIMFNSLLKSLAERGHKVTAYKTLPIEDKPQSNYKEILLPNYLEELKKTINFNVVEFGKMGFVGEMMSVNEIGYLVSEASFKTKEFKQLMESKDKYDLVITESFFAQYSIAALAHRFDAPHVAMMALGNSHWTNFMTGNPYSPSYIPDFNSGSTWKMNYLERLLNTVKSIATILVTQFHYLPKFQMLVDRYFVYEGSSSRPKLTKILANVSMVLENSHLILNGAAPMAPNLVPVAGLNIKPNKPLPPKFKKWLDEAKEGCIYFSYGTVVQGGHIDDKIKKIFVNVFSKLKQRVLWKMDQKMQLPNNVMTEAWMPQQDILVHPNTVLFITHGGYLSINEAVNYGVPLIGTPFFGDQGKNLNEVAQSGYGIRLDYENITEDSLMWAINEIIGNSRFKTEVKKKSAIYRDRQHSALDNAVYWVEYVLRHEGAPHLRPQSTFMPWYQAELLDVAAAGLVLLVVTILMLRKFFLFITCQTFRQNRNKQKTS